MKLRLLCIALTAALAVAPTAFASSEGGTELNDAVAAAGLGPFDPPGYPIMIQDSGRYRLTGDLHPPSGFPAIELMASDVVIALGGHQIVGSLGSGGGGIRGFGGPVQRNIVIENGAILRMGGPGIELPEAEHVTLRAVRISESAGPGVLLGRGATIERSELTDNQACGAELREDAAVRDTRAHRNQQCGLQVGDGFQLSRVQANENTAAGLVLGGGGSAHHVISSRNVGDGVQIEEMAGGGPYPPAPFVELGDVTVTGNEIGIKITMMRVKLQDAVVGGNRQAGIETHDTHLTLGSVALSENGGAGLYGESSMLSLADVTIHDNGHMGGDAGVRAYGTETGFSARGLVAYGNHGSAIDLNDMDASIQDFTIRDNGKSFPMPGIWFGGPFTLTLQSGVLKNNGDGGLRCMPPDGGVIFGDVKAFGNPGGSIVDCMKAETGPNHCGPVGGAGAC